MISCCAVISQSIDNFGLVEELGAFTTATFQFCSVFFLGAGVEDQENISKRAWAKFFD